MASVGKPKATDRSQMRNRSHLAEEANVVLSNVFYIFQSSRSEWLFVITKKRVLFAVKRDG